LIQKVSRSAEGDFEKGLHTRHQMSVYESLLDIRIRSQRLLHRANDLPPPPVLVAMSHFDEGTESRPSVADEISTVKQSLCGLIHQLMDVKAAFVQENQTAIEQSNSKDKNAVDDFVRSFNRQSLVSSLNDDQLSTAKRSKLCDAFFQTAWNQHERMDTLCQPFQHETMEKWQRKVHIAGTVLKDDDKMKS
jgi:hypothetical protein